MDTHLVKLLHINLGFKMQACVHFSQSFESRRKGYALSATIRLHEYEALSRRLSFSQVMLNARFLIEPESSDKTDWLAALYRCHGLRVYPVCVCNMVRLPGTGQSAHVIGGSRFTRPASNWRRTLLNWDCWQQFNKTPIFAPTSNL